MLLSTLRCLSLLFVTVLVHHEFEMATLLGTCLKTKVLAVAAAAKFLDHAFHSERMDSVVLDLYSEIHAFHSWNGKHGFPAHVYWS